MIQTDADALRMLTRERQVQLAGDALDPAGRSTFAIARWISGRRRLRWQHRIPASRVSPLATRPRLPTELVRTTDEP